MNFPMYRKYINGASIFEILSPEEFREVQVIGHFYEIHHIKASILPERNYLIDLINNEDGYYLEMSRDEFLSELKSIKEQREPLRWRLSPMALVLFCPWEYDC